MAEIDKVLEAEQAIQDIASELEKMKEAAALLETAQDKTNRVIEASDAIITRVGDFVRKGSEIVNRIGDYDIQEDMQKLQEELSNVNKVVNDKLMFLKDMLVENQTNILQATDKTRSDIGEFRTVIIKKSTLLNWIIGVNIGIYIVILLKVLSVF